MWVPSYGSTKNTSRGRYKPCKCGHQDTQLALERLNPKTMPVGKAGEGSTESRGHKGLQTRQWPRSNWKGIRNTGDEEIVQEENQTKKIKTRIRNGKMKTQWGHSTGTGEHFSSRILDRPRTKEKEATHRQCKRQPKHSPSHSVLGWPVH